MDFGYVYGAETIEPGETEVTLWATDRRGKDAGHYDAQDYRIEVERALTDQLQLAIYANLAGHHIRGVEPGFDDVDRNLGFQGLSAEFKYNVVKPGGRRFGLAFYAEPAWSRIHKVEGEKVTEYELELKAIVQRNFLDDRLVWVGNLTLEPEWERETEELSPAGAEKEWEKELKIEFTTGLSYQVAPRWALGFEGRYTSDYPDWTHGLHRDAYSVSAGPMVHFSAGKLGITATYLPQLFGRHKGDSTNLELEGHEKQELRLKLSYEF